MGEVQIMSAGTGITHSEFNDSPTDEVHFLQLWIIPAHENVTPSYTQKRFDLDKRDHAFQTLVSPNNALVSDSLGINQQGYIHIGNFSKNSVDIKFKKQYNAWIVRDDESIFALSTVCTHLGCTPNWLPVESKFKCPCHGSGFRMTGIHFEGPAPRPLERFKISLANDGQILVDKTKSYKWEKGEWENPESFLKV